MFDAEATESEAIFFLIVSSLQNFCWWRKMRSLKKSDWRSCDTNCLSAENEGRYGVWGGPSLIEDRATQNFYLQRMEMQSLRESDWDAWFEGVGLKVLRCTVSIWRGLKCEVWGSRSYDLAVHNLYLRRMETRSLKGSESVRRSCDAFFFYLQRVHEIMSLRESWLKILLCENCV